MGLLGKTAQREEMLNCMHPQELNKCDFRRINNQADAGGLRKLQGQVYDMATEIRLGYMV